MSRIEVIERGSPSADTIIFVHGSLNDANAAFRSQLELAERWHLLMPNRRGYGASPRTGPVDLDVDAGDIAGLVGKRGAHLVGSSMGGVVVARAAALLPGRVLSLTMIEPPAWPAAMDIPEAAKISNALRRHWETADRSDPVDFLRGFTAALGSDVKRPDRLSPEAETATRNLMSEEPWNTAVPVGTIAAAPFPKLLVSADWSLGFNAVCDRLAEVWRGERRIFPGAGHAVQRVGKPFNDLLEAFMLGTLSSTTAARPSSGKKNDDLGV